LTFISLFLWRQTKLYCVFLVYCPKFAFRYFLLVCRGRFILNCRFFLLNSFLFYRRLLLCCPFFCIFINLYLLFFFLYWQFRRLWNKIFLLFLFHKFRFNIIFRFRIYFNYILHFLKFADILLNFGIRFFCRLFIFFRLLLCHWYLIVDRGIFFIINIYLDVLRLYLYCLAVLLNKIRSFLFFAFIFAAFKFNRLFYCSNFLSSHLIDIFSRLNCSNKSQYSR
jgi:hypothetical protein